MDSASEFDFGYLPMNRKEPSLGDKQRLKEIYPKLMQVRMQRITPKDTKLLAGLNGLALEAFSEAAGLAPRYRQAAAELRTFILNKFWQNGELSKGVSRQQLLGRGDLESYAYTAYGLLKYAQLEGNNADTKVVRQIAQTTWQKFYTPQGFLLEQGGELAKPYYQAVIEDGPLPSPSSSLINTSLQSGDKALRAKASNALADGDALHKRGLFWIASQVIALNRYFDMRVKP